MGPEAPGSNSVEAPKNFFSGYFRNCLNCDSLPWSHTHFKTSFVRKYANRPRQNKKILWIRFSRTHLTVGYSFKPRAGKSHLLGEISFMSRCFCLGLCGVEGIFCKNFYSSRAASTRCCTLIY